MEILRILAGPLIGAVIGYCTNFIAVKMLFYPRRELHMFGHRLPFTPGAIPKGQPRLAAAIGTVIETHLLTKADLEEMLLSEAVEKRVAGAVVTALSGNIQAEICALTGTDSDVYRQKRYALCQEAGARIVETIQASDITEKLLNEIGASLREKAQGSAWKLLINSKTIGSFIGPTQEQLDRMIDEHGAAYIAPILEKELTKADSGTGMELLERLGRDEDAVRAMAIRIYRKIVSEYAETLLSQIHISTLVEDKINAMSVAELERLVWSVMRQELSTIINLGALIGLVLGLLTLFF